MKKKTYKLNTRTNQRKGTSAVSDRLKIFYHSVSLLRVAPPCLP